MLKYILLSVALAGISVTGAMAQEAVIEEPQINLYEDWQVQVYDDRNGTIASTVGELEPGEEASNGLPPVLAIEHNLTADNTCRRTLTIEMPHALEHAEVLEFTIDGEFYGLTVDRTGDAERSLSTILSVAAVDNDDALWERLMSGTMLILAIADYDQVEVELTEFSLTGSRRGITAASEQCQTLARVAAQESG